jgi:hypothetical protein
MMRSPHFAGIAVLIACGAALSWSASPASVSGVVRDSAGVPQIGAQVELLRPDLSIAASAYTNSEGRYLLTSLVPGKYAIKAMGTSFLPALRENVKVRGTTVVNLTLNTLYEAIQWLPAEPRAGNAQKDDWAWTLRSAANRPLLRWLEDGPLVVVSDGPGKTPKLKARLMAIGQEGTFGESGERFSATVEDTPNDSRELLARVDFAPDTDAGMESMLGFRQDLGFAGAVQSVAAVNIEPAVEGAGDRGLEEAVIRNDETMRLGDIIEAEAGSTMTIARLSGASPRSVTAVLPFAAVDWRKGAATVHYRMATMTAERAVNAEDSETAAWMPAVGQRAGSLTIERGFHQEIGWERQTEKSGVSVLLYSDKIDNPVFEAMGQFAPDSPETASGDVLFDATSQLLRAAGPGFSTAGVEASLERRLPDGNRVRLSYASGAALAVPALPRPVALDTVLAAARPRRAQTYAITLSGILDGTGTRWRASYRWQADETVTAVDAFAQDFSAPYLNVHLRQPIRLSRDGSGGLEALLDVRNLLAEGYRPLILNDGSLVIFAQDQRSLRAGLAFTF